MGHGSTDFGIQRIRRCRCMLHWQYGVGIILVACSIECSNGAGQFMVLFGITFSKVTTLMRLVAPGTSPFSF